MMNKMMTGFIINILSFLYVNRTWTLLLINLTSLQSNDNDATVGLVLKLYALWYKS